MNIIGMVRPFSTQGMKADAVRDESALTPSSMIEILTKTVTDLDKDKELKNILLHYYTVSELEEKNYDSQDLDIIGKVGLITSLVERVYQEIKDINKDGFVNSFDLNNSKFTFTSRIVDKLLAKNDEGVVVTSFNELENKDKVEFLK